MKTELTEFVIFISIVLFLFIVGIVRRGILFSLIGMIITLFMMPFTIGKLIMERAYIVNQATGELVEHVVYADSTLITLIFVVVFLLFFMQIVWCRE